MPRYRILIDFPPEYREGIQRRAKAEHLDPAVYVRRLVCLDVDRSAVFTAAATPSPPRDGEEA